MKRLIDKANRSWKGWLAQMVRTSPCLYLINDRLEPMPQGPAGRVRSIFRQYLHVSKLMRIICGDSRFAVEIMGWASRYRDHVDLHLRLCRFCRTCIETPERAVFLCRGDQSLIMRRDTFWTAIHAVSEVQPPSLPGPAIEAFQSLLTDIKTVSLLAEFTHHVVSLYDEYMPLWPDATIH